jgi:ribosomal protein S18 acetylase RimI-like enzyme
VEDCAKNRAVTRLTPADANRAACVVQLAFEDYAYMRYIAPDSRQRARLSAWFAGCSARYGLHYGEVYSNAEVNGVAVWLTPGDTELTPWRLLRCGFFAAPFAAGLAGIRRFISTSLHMEREHARFAPGPHWYLFALAVEPAQQGRGIGGALLQPALAEADAAGTPCYLETHTEHNTRFYRRHGFEVMSQKVLPDSEMAIYAMLRAPHT